ncbi:MAG: hypothetical protein ACXVBW_11910, partial [Bdellovibrionota bacterium]
MHTIFMMARFYPYWALPLAVLVGDIGLYFRRKKNDIQWALWSLAGFLVLGIIVWVAFRGDLNSDQWVRTF